MVAHGWVVPDGYRDAGLGSSLKLLQRERALTPGLDLVEWTYDPLQAMNAHLNFAKLGVVVEEYEENIYGESASPLHGGNPTDRFVADWWMRERPCRAGACAALHRWHPVADAWDRPTGRARPPARWLEPAAGDLSLDARRMTVEIPAGFTEMLSRHRSSRSDGA